MNQGPSGLIYHKISLEMWKPMKKSIYRYVAATLAVAAGLILPAERPSAEYPEKPIRIIVPYQPGGGTDIVARLIGPKLSDTFKQPVVVENKPGAGGVIAVGTVAKASPDGYTILIDAPGITINPALFRKAPYDPIQDFEPVAQLFSMPYAVVVNPTMKVANIGELISLAKSKPGQINVAFPGPSIRLAAELFRLQAVIEVTFIPYKKGSAPALTSVISGETQLMFSDLPSVVQHVRAGQLKLLAVTGGRRSSLMPKVPTVKESGLESYEITSWTGIFAPTGTPRNVVARLNKELGRIIFLDDVSGRLSALGAEPVSTTPEEFAAFYRDEVRRWKDVVQRANLQAVD